MTSRALRIFLFVTFAYWATGVGRYVHERLDHRHGPRPERLVATVVPVRSAVTSSIAASELDDHDGCLICQMLAAMSADGPLPPAVLTVHAPCPDQAVVPGRLAPVLRFAPYLSARGPP